MIPSATTPKTVSSPPPLSGKTSTYDGLGHRVATATPAATTISFWDQRFPGGALLDQWTSGNYQTSYHIINGLTPLAVEPLNGSASQRHANYLGSIDATTDSAGHVEWTSGYDPTATPPAPKPRPARLRQFRSATPDRNSTPTAFTICAPVNTRWACTRKACSRTSMSYPRRRPTSLGLSA